MEAGMAVGASTAGLVGVDRDESAFGKAAGRDILFEPAGEFMARNEGLADDCATNAAILVIMEVRAAQADGGDFQKGLAFRAFAQIERRHTRIECCVEIESFHNETIRRAVKQINAQTSTN